MAQPKGQSRSGFTSSFAGQASSAAAIAFTSFSASPGWPLCQNPFGLIPSFTGVFRGKLLDKLLDCEIFMTLEQVETLVENCRKHNSLRKPHRFRNGKPPAPLRGFISPHMGPGPILPSSEARPTGSRAEPQRIYHQHLT